MKGFGWLLDLVYPPACGICGVALRKGAALCGPCRDDLPRLEEPFCETCGEHFEGAMAGPFACPNCRQRKLAFAFARPALLRDDRTRKLILDLKYRRGIHLAGELGKLAAESYQDERMARALELRWPLIPVPVHRWRLKARFYNQAGEIARALGAELGLPVIPALKRIRHTNTQTRLTRAQRLSNLKGAFALSRAGQRLAATMPSGVVLVDDVFTTGSTVDECARTLRRAGVQKVIVVTVMRG